MSADSYNASYSNAGWDGFIPVSGGVGTATFRLELDDFKVGGVFVKTRPDTTMMAMYSMQSYQGTAVAVQSEAAPVTQSVPAEQTGSAGAASPPGSSASKDLASGETTDSGG
jgi:hypothetical protein